MLHSPCFRFDTKDNRFLSTWWSGQHGNYQCLYYIIVCQNCCNQSTQFIPNEKQIQAAKQRSANKRSSTYSAAFTSLSAAECSAAYVPVSCPNEWHLLCTQGYRSSLLVLLCVVYKVIRCNKVQELSTGENSFSCMMCVMPCLHSDEYIINTFHFKLSYISNARFYTGGGQPLPDYYSEQEAAWRIELFR